MKKKILIFHHYGGLGGAGLSLLHILQSLDKKKYEIIVVCPSKPREMIDEMKKINNINIHETINTPMIFPHYSGGSKFFLHPTYLKGIYRLFKDYNNVRKIIETYKPELIITNSMTLFWINKLSKKMSIKNICFHRETYAKGLLGIRTMYLKKGLSNSNVVCFISKYDLDQSKNIDTKKVVIYDKVDFEKYRDFEKKPSDIKLQDNKKYILYLGGVSKLKGFHIMIDAFAKIKNDDVELIVLGGVQNKNWSPRQHKYYSDALRKLTESKKLSKTHLLNLTSSPEIYYNVADIIVFPSTSPHQARPIYEAGISKKPIIITNFKQTSEFAQDKKNAYTFKKNDSNELANILDEVLGESDNNVNNIIEENYLLAKKDHNLETLKDELTDLIEVVISNNN